MTNKTSHHTKTHPSDDDIQTPDSPPTSKDQPPVDAVVPVGAEQLARSREMETAGVEAWKAAHDERSPDQQPQSVAGVGWAPAPGEATHGGLRSR
jgi:hypothetical protein